MRFWLPPVGRDSNGAIQTRVLARTVGWGQLASGERRPTMHTRMVGRRPWAPLRGARGLAPPYGSVTGFARILAVTRVHGLTSCKAIYESMNNPGQEGVRAGTIIEGLSIKIIE